LFSAVATGAGRPTLACGQHLVVLPLWAAASKRGRRSLGFRTEVMFAACLERTERIASHLLKLRG
jgi:hypothetical protein